MPPLGIHGGSAQLEMDIYYYYYYYYYYYNHNGYWGTGPVYRLMTLLSICPQKEANNNLASLEVASIQHVELPSRSRRSRTELS